MPYSIRKSGEKYKVVNKETGKVHAKGTTKAKAQAQVNLLRAEEHNPSWKPTGKKAKK